MQVLQVDYRAKNAPKFFCQSLKNTGFGVLTHHTISNQLIELAYQQWKDFFASEEKFNYRHQKPTQDGYFPFRTENAKDAKVSDLKEFYHFYPSGRQPLETKVVTRALYTELTEMAAVLLQWIEDQLPRAVASQLSMPLRDMITNSQNTLLRILHYPPLSGEIEAGAVRAAAHEDINLITLLTAATAPGLEVLDTQDRWHEVPCDPGNIVVNVGDMLQLATQNYYKSTTHRVVNPGGAIKNVSRYSMPLFLHPRPEVLLSPTCTAEEYLHERLRQIGIY
jgi:isopenicillin N synthase-like dioxygenase